MPAQSRGVQELTISNPSTLHPTSLRDPNQEREQWYVNHKMKKLDIPSIPEPFDIIADGGAGLRACKASVDLFSRHCCIGCACLKLWGCRGLSPLRHLRVRG